MARRHSKPTPNVTRSLVAHRRKCVGCGGPLWSAYWQERSILSLAGQLRLRLHPFVKIASARCGMLPVDVALDLFDDQRATRGETQ